MKNIKYLFLLIYTLLVILSLYLTTQEEGMKLIAWLILILITFPTGLLFIVSTSVLLNFVTPSCYGIDLIAHLTTFLMILTGYYQWFVWFPKKFIETGKYKEYTPKLIINILFALFLIFMTLHSILALKYPDNIIWTIIWVSLALLFKYKEYKKSDNA